MKHNKQRGSLLLLSALVLLGIAAITALVVSNNTAVSPRNNEALNRAEYLLSGFVFAHYRLPCPDVNADGIEDCADTSQKGRLPYKTLGLVSPLTGEFGGHLLYAPYRKANATAKDDIDLVTNKDRYVPDVALATALPSTGSDPALTLDSTNLLDFCQALKTQTTTAYDAALPNIAAVLTNVAVVLVDPGKNTQLDTDNADADLSFANPSTASLSTYDDSVQVLSFQTLSAQYACVGLISSIDLLADTSQNAQKAVDGAIEARDDSAQDLALTAVDTLLSGLGLLTFAAGLQASITDAVKDTTICAASLGILANFCTAAVLAAAATVAFTVGLAAAIVALVLQIASVAMAIANLVIANEFIDQTTNTLNTLVKQAVYADMRGGVE